MEQDNVIPLLKGDEFTFSCSHEIRCFNECCKDLNQFLTPYDILRLKKRLGLTSSEFLDQYTHQHTGPESGLPVITLKTDYALAYHCPFSSESGCTVYSDRPSSCRIYPLARLVSRSKETGKIQEQYYLIQEDHCQGLNEGRTWTSAEWIKDQGLEVYNEMNDLLLELISLKNKLIAGPLDAKSRHLFHMALYDLDGFRKQVFEKKLLDPLKPNPEKLDLAREDDVALLKLGFQWIKYSVFGFTDDRRKT